MSMEDNKAIVRRFLEALDRQNFDALQGHPGLYQTVVRQPLIGAAFPDLQTTIEHQVDGVLAKLGVITPPGGEIPRPSAPK